MSVTSKFVRLDTNILLEYIYNDSNYNSDDYSILVDTKNSRRTYYSSDNGTNRLKKENTIFDLDSTIDKFSNINTEVYPFIQIQDYAGTIPVIYDKIRIHLPSSYNFDSNFGFYLNVTVYDYKNQNTFDLCQFYYDNSNPDHQRDLLVFAAPGFMFLETFWGKYIEFDIPSARELAKQRDSITGNAKNNSINFNLTNGIGISNNSPIFIDFAYLAAEESFKNVPYYFLTDHKQTTVPLVAEFENLGIMIEESKIGDYFEIYGIYNQSLGEFDSFIERERSNGHRYQVQYDITLYEENLKGKKQSILIVEDFNEKVEYRPIIKTSSTTAMIEVEMRVIDIVDSSFIYRRAAFGMLPEQVAKYSLYMTKINIDGAVTPTIYNLKSKSLNMNELFNKPKKTESLMNNNVRIERVNTPFPVLVDKYYVVAKSSNGRANQKLYYGLGKLQIIMYPFDNTIQFSIANSIDETRVDPFDLSSSTKINLVFKDNKNEISVDLYTQSKSIDLTNGQLVFKVSSSQIPTIRTIAESGKNLFYIIANIQNEKTVIYSGSFVFFDSLENIKALNQEVENIIDDQSDEDITVTDQPRETAIVSRKKIITKS